MYLPPLVPGPGNYKCHEQQRGSGGNNRRHPNRVAAVENVTNVNVKMFMGEATQRFGKITALTSLLEFEEYSYIHRAIIQIGFPTVQ